MARIVSEIDLEIKLQREVKYGEKRGRLKWMYRWEKKDHRLKLRFRHEGIKENMCTLPDGYKPESIWFRMFRAEKASQLSQRSNCSAPKSRFLISSAFSRICMNKPPLTCQARWQ